MPWQEIETSLAQRWARQVKAGKKIEDLHLFGPVLFFLVQASPPLDVCVCPPV
jgi:hypothetical protein